MEQKLHVTTFVKPDLWDALKLLFGRSMKVETFIIVPQEQEIPMYNSYSEVSTVDTTAHFIKQDKPGFGYVHTPKKE